MVVLATNIFDQVAEFFKGIGSSEFWPARWNCGIWTDFHGWMYIISEVVIWAAYFAIPVLLVRLVMAKKDIPVPKVFWLFGAFILLCGTTHLVDAIIFWFPIYRVSAFLRAITAVVSLATVFALLKVLPEVLKLKTSVQFNEELEKRKLVEQQLREAKERAEQSEQYKEQFLANMSHEIRTPMNSIVGFTRLLEETGLTKHQKDYVEAIKTSGDNLLVIINDILDLSKINAGKLDLSEECWNFKGGVKSVVNQFIPLCEEKELGMKLNMAEGLPDYIIADKVRVSQILTNLLSNAVKFTDSGGVQLDITKTESHIVFAVKDTGIGIAEEDLAGIFESFTQVKIGRDANMHGTGLGLAITKKLVEKMGGEVEASSAPGVGSRFSFSIPCRVGTPLHESVVTEEHYTPNSLSDIHVLVAEDNRLNQRLIKTILKQWDVEFSMVSNGLEAFNAVKRNRDKYDVVLMDVQMPVMDGLEATEAIRELDIAVPIVALTAHALESEMQRCKQSGMNDFMAKPFKKEDLIDVIHRNMGSKLSA